MTKYTMTEAAKKRIVASVVATVGDEDFTSRLDIHTTIKDAIEAEGFRGYTSSNVRLIAGALPACTVVLLVDCLLWELDEARDVVIGMQNGMKGLMEWKA